LATGIELHARPRAALCRYIFTQALASIQ
jgi:hypothetical protein